MLTMNPIRQRLVTGAAVTALALGVALGLAGGAAPSAHAELNDGGAAGICYWDGKAYSQGAEVVATDSRGVTHTYQCQANGTWLIVALTRPPTSPLPAVSPASFAP
jgi:hypothetical protein